MLSLLVIAYLFLGGVGAGALAVVCALDLVFVRTPFGADAPVSLDEASPAGRACAWTTLVALGSLALGALCLAFDLGRADRLLVLFASPMLTYLSVGAYALAALLACAAFLAAARFLYLPAVGRRAVVAVEAVAAASSLVVMAYTGLLLMDTVGVPLWRTPLVPALFMLSSASCGIAVALLCSWSQEECMQVEALARGLVRADMLIIALEAAAAGAFLAVSQGSADSAAAASAQDLAQGGSSLWWWLGFALCGLAAPFALEAASAVRSRFAGAGFHAAVRPVFACAAALVLVGGFSLRYAIADAGAHRDLELQAAEQLDAEAPTLQAPQTADAAQLADAEGGGHGSLRR